MSYTYVANNTFLWLATLADRETTDEFKFPNPNAAKPTKKIVGTSADVSRGAVAMLGQLRDTDAWTDNEIFETPFERQIADRLEGLLPNQRGEPRTRPTNKNVRLTAELDVQVRDESRSGMCLRVPCAAQTDIDQELWVADGNHRRKGVVRWIRAGDSPATKFVGFEWTDAEPSTHATRNRFREESRLSHILR